ncbi:hypothetical protein FRB99_001263 [Tulasnella sp. 403]|nr:hypothetical protein FRB99_001263 [Tulasnella sp. 403]
MSLRPERFDKIDLTPKRWHGYAVILFILGTLFPPLAVAARFGFGKDFTINLILTLCGYFPGHGHNFYIQNIRNNKNHRRTPKWAVRYGLIDDTALKRRAKRSQWASRYDERLPQSAHVGQEVEEGQVPDREQDEANRPSGSNGDQLWTGEEETFYGRRDTPGSAAQSESSGGGRWHYPANFDEAEPSTPVAPKKSRLGKKKDKKDRWARTEDAHANPQKKKKKSKRSSDGMERWDNRSSTSIPEEPEDAVGGLYGESRAIAAPSAEARRVEEDQALNHQF